MFNCTCDIRLHLSIYIQDLVPSTPLIPEALAAITYIFLPLSMISLLIIIITYLADKLVCQNCVRPVSIYSIYIIQAASYSATRPDYHQPQHITVWFVCILPHQWSCDISPSTVWCQCWSPTLLHVGVLQLDSC